MDEKRPTELAPGAAVTKLGLWYTILLRLARHYGDSIVKFMSGSPAGLHRGFDTVRIRYIYTKALSCTE